MKVSGLFHRFVCLLLVCLLLIPTALADTVDLSAMSNEEIIELLNQVNAEIVSRGINKTATLPQGTYNAGSDIPFSLVWQLAMIGAMLRFILTVVKESRFCGMLFQHRRRVKIRQQSLSL